MKTATFKLHNPSRRKRAMLDYALETAFFNAKQTGIARGIASHNLPSRSRASLAVSGLGALST